MTTTGFGGISLNTSDIFANTVPSVDINYGPSIPSAQEMVRQKKAPGGGQLPTSTTKTEIIPSSPFVTPKEPAKLEDLIGAMSAEQLAELIKKAEELQTKKVVKAEILQLFSENTFLFNPYTQECLFKLTHPTQQGWFIVVIQNLEEMKGIQSGNELPGTYEVTAEQLLAIIDGWDRQVKSQYYDVSYAWRQELGVARG
jgi:hypothetical protein